MSTAERDTGPYDLDPVKMLEDEIFYISFAIKDPRNAASVKDLKNDLKKLQKKLAIEKKKVGGSRRRRTMKHKRGGRKTLRRHL